MIAEPLHKTLGVAFYCYKDFMNMENHFNFIIKGSPEIFYGFLNNYVIEREYTSDDRFYWVRDIQRNPGDSHGMVFLWDKKGNHKTLAFIKVLNLPEDNQTYLNVHFPSREWENLKYWWELLRDEMIRVGYIVTNQQTDNLSLAGKNPVKEQQQGDLLCEEMEHQSAVNLQNTSTIAKTEVQSVSQSISKETIKESWEMIDDIGWDRKALELWWKGHTNEEIAAHVGKSKLRVTNHLSELRQKHGKEIVPLAEERRKLLLKL